MSNRPFNWPPDRVALPHFVQKIKGYFAGGGVIFTPEVGYEYIVQEQVLYRHVGGSLKLIGNVYDLMELSDEQLYEIARK